jgi:hypothetical protein
VRQMISSQLLHAVACSLCEVTLSRTSRAAFVAPIFAHSSHVIDSQNVLATSCLSMNYTNRYDAMRRSVASHVILIFCCTLLRKSLQIIFITFLSTQFSSRWSVLSRTACFSMFVFHLQVRILLTAILSCKPSESCNVLYITLV